MRLDARLDAIQSTFLNGKEVQRQGLPFTRFLLFGAGTRGILIKRYFASLGAEALCFIDNNCDLIDTQIEGLHVLRLAEAMQQYPGIPVYIASSHYPAIALQLMGAGITSYYCMPMTSFYFSPTFYQDNYQQLNAVHDLLFDTASKNTYAAIIKTYQTGDDGNLILSHYAQYRHPVVKACDGDTIIDGGAFDGDSLELFHTGATALKVFCLEPTESAYTALQSRASRFGDSCVCLQKGLWSEETTLRFSTQAQSATGNKILKSGSSTIACTSIDSLVREYHLDQVDLIKLDIEGAEEEALKGATATIRAAKPKLQVALYHNMEDLYKIPLLLHDINPGYIFYIGHHAPNAHESILYCIDEKHFSALPC